MAQTVLRLLPPPHEELPLAGLYLAHGLHTLGSRGRPLVYTNFIASLDGRIALPDPARGIHRIPKSLANARDWRLFQELAAQADLVLTSGRYLRDLAKGQAQAALPVSSGPKHADLLRWRSTHGLSHQPDVAILSASLEVPIPASLLQEGRKIHVFTGGAADPQRVRALEDQGVNVLFAGRDRWVEGRALMALLTDMGFTSIYSTAGPEVLHTLLTAGALDRLYLTFAHVLMAGEEYDTLLKGTLLNPPMRLTLTALYYDPHAPAGAGQTFGVFERARG